MNKKSIFTLLGILIALILVALLVENLGKRDEKKVEEESVLFPEFDAGRVSSIELKTKERKVILNKEGDKWLVATADNYPADQEAVQKMLDTAKELKSSLTASKSADKHAQFEVDEVNAVGVAMLGEREGDVEAQLYVGKMGADYMSTYIRKADQDTILLANGYLKSVFDKGVRGWRDRTIFDFEADQVQKLTLLSQENGEIVVEAKQEGGWQIISPEISPAKDDEMDSILQEVSKLSADDFAEKKEPAEKANDEAEEEQPSDPIKEYKLDDPQSQITVDLKDGTARILLVGDLSGQQHYVMREGKDTIFMLSKSKLDRIFKKLEDLKAEPEEVTPDEEAVPDTESKPE